jgi:large subunit ribosomal protein L17
MSRLRKYKQLNTYPKKRWSMLRNMTASLFLHERIMTTDARAKALTKAVGAIFRKANKFSSWNRDHIKGLLRVKSANHKLFTDLIRRYRLYGGNIIQKKDILKRREGDCAKMIRVELINKYN